MSSALDVHEASPKERRAAFANVFEVWPQAPTQEEHIRRRESMPHHRRARWFVGTHSGQVVCSLGVYPLRMAVHGQIVQAMAIGSVHTVPEYRGRGYATQLIQTVHEQMAQEGVQLSLLYSDIDPKFYRRLGYQECPSWAGWLETHHAPPPHKDTFVQEASWEEIAPLAQRFYWQYHGHRALAIWRSEEYWSVSVQRWPDTPWLGFFSGTKSSKTMVGYARVRIVQDRAHLLDWSLSGETEATLGQMLQALAPWCAKRGCKYLGGWLPGQDSSLQAVVELAPRSREITMICPLDPEIACDEECRLAADWFTQADHV